MFGFCSPFFIKTGILHSWGDYGLCIPLLWHCFTWSFNSTWWRWRFLDALISYSNVAPKLNHFIPLLQSQTYFIIFLPQNSFRHNMESGFIYLIKYAAPFRLRRNIFKLLKIKAIFFRNSNVLLLSGFLMVMEIMIELLVWSSYAKCQVPNARWTTL